MEQTVSDFHGRQVWEFDPDAGTDEERSKVEQLRRTFTENRFRRRESQDLLMRMQLTGNKHLHADMPAATKIEYGDEVTEETLQESLRRALGWMSALQAEDGHCPGDFSGIMYLLPFWIFALHITGSVDAVLSKEHIREICRHIYNHQMFYVKDMSTKSKRGKNEDINSMINEPKRHIVLSWKINIVGIKDK
ncbi:achilleol B synthase-like [Miscanthus floridulus]|uniref:achilleol B synthase-like n=1 Tax=Miscanthus floridulus TaxID=154761 RepID=UPI0034578A6A